MNGLVGYDSSDEEENLVSDPTSQPRHVAIPNAATPAEGDETGLNGSSISARTVTGPVQGPITGPSRPSQDDYAMDGYEDDAVSSMASMPEHDLLRQLTQPSHPVFSFPPDPEGQADPEVTAKFKNFLDLKKKGRYFNENLADKNSFKNPNLFASLLERLGLRPEAQYGSSLPSDVISLVMFPPWVYKEELLRSQQEIDSITKLNKKAESSTGNRTIQFTKAKDHSQMLEGTHTQTLIKTKKP